MIRLAAACVIAVAVHSAQSAPPTQTVFKCTKDGKTIYTDEPCLGAVEVDATPTQGMDKSTGTSRRGADVLHDEQREAIARALKPITGLDREGLDRAGRRSQLTGDAQAECKRLDASMPNLAMQQADPNAAALLLQQRKRFKALGC